jgi:hypothetical protein
MDLSPADFFQIPKVKEQLSDITLIQGPFKSKLERAIRTIALKSSPPPISGGYSEIIRSHRRLLCEEIITIKVFSNCIRFCFIHTVSFELELTSYVSIEKE